jgi:hypothetical protein
MRGSNLRDIKDMISTYQNKNLDRCQSGTEKNVVVRGGNAKSHRSVTISREILKFRIPDSQSPQPKIHSDHFENAPFG